MTRQDKRKRIVYGETIGEIVIDTEAFIKNKTSANARKVTTISEQIEFEIYFDKHYFIRQQHGDSDGKREGIELEFVKSLVLEATKHLLYYSIRLKGFTFVNFEEATRLGRIVLTKLINGEDDLNVVLEYHYLKMHKYEVTLVTALRKVDFRINDGDYQVKIETEGDSNLYKNELRKIKHLGNYDGDL